MPADISLARAHAVIQVAFDWDDSHLHVFETPYGGFGTAGGIWGYAELAQVLSDPTDPEHEERLEWLGLDDAADFDPDRFDATAVTRALSTLR